MLLAATDRGDEVAVAAPMRAERQMDVEMTDAARSYEEQAAHEQRDHP